MRENVGRYRLLTPLGRGAMGAVYLASDSTLNRQVAIKMVDVSVEELSQRSFLRDRLLRDAKAAALLSHPNIVGIYDVIEEEGAVFVVMEYVPGESLASYLERNPAPDAHVTLQLLRQMASALDYTHSKGIIHRDIKPGNVMRDPNGTVKILDFGIARLSDGVTSTPTGMVMGTIEYMSPEQVKGESLDGRSDQFSLAAVAYRMLTGSTLFGSHTLATLTYKLVNEVPPLPTQRNTLLPPAVDRVLMRALAKSPAERYRSCCEFAEVLGQAMTNEREMGGSPTAVASGIVTPVVPTVLRSAPPKSRLVAALAVAACLAVCAVVLFIWKPWNRQTQTANSTSTPTLITQPTQAETRPLPQPVENNRPPRRVPSTAATTRGPLPIVPPSVTSKSQTRPAEKPPDATPGQKIDTVELQRLYRNGRQQLQDRDFSAAIQSFTAVIAKDPNFKKVYHERGYAYQLANQTDSAIQDFSRAIQLDPQDAMSYSDRAVCLAHLRHDDQAMADFNRALEIKPDLAAALNGRGAILLRRGRYVLAIRSFDAAIASNPKFAPAYENRAKAKRATGDNAGAEADSQKARGLKSSDGEP